MKMKVFQGLSGVWACLTGGVSEGCMVGVLRGDSGGVVEWVSEGVWVEVEVQEEAGSFFEEVSS